MEDNEKIEKIFICSNGLSDVLVCYYDKNDEFSIKSVFYLITRMKNMNVFAFTSEEG